MNRIFTRKLTDKAKEVSSDLLISVIGIGRGVGTTTIATTLAFCFAEKGERVTFIEGSDARMVNSMLYCQVAMDKRFGNRNFTDFYKMVSLGEPIKKKENFEEGVYWVLVTPENCKEKIVLDTEKQNRILRNTRGIRILDVTDRTGWEELLIDSDYIFAVVDPLPSKLITNVDTYRKVRKLEAKGANVFWIVNKNNKGVNKHQIKEYLKSNNVVWIDTVAEEKIYSEEFACRFHWKNAEIYSKIMDIFTKISQ